MSKVGTKHAAMTCDPVHAAMTCDPVHAAMTCDPVHAAMTCDPVQYLTNFGGTDTLSDHDAAPTETYLVHVWSGAMSTTWYMSDQGPCQLLGTCLLTGHVNYLVHVWSGAMSTTWYMSGQGPCQLLGTCLVRGHVNYNC